MKFKNIILIICSLFSISIFGQMADDVLFKIDGKQITTAAFLHAYHKNNIKNVADKKKDIEEYLQFFIDFKLKIAEAKSQQLNKKNSFKQELAMHEKQLKKSYLVEKKVTEKLIVEAFERSKIELKVAHILINCNLNASPKDTLKAYEKISNLKDSLKKNNDFKYFAKNYSQDPSAKTNFGEIGYISTFNTVYPFENEAFKTEVGAISNIARTQYGYHLIKVLDKRKNLGKLQVAQLFLSCNENAPKKIILKKENEINEIYQKINLKKVSFEDAVEQYSQDFSSKKNKGLINAFAQDEKSIEFEKAAFSILKENQICKPFKTNKGFYILKLVKKQSLKNIAAERNDLTKKILKDERSKLPENLFIEKIKQQNNFKSYRNNKTQFLKKLMQHNFNKKWSLTTFKNNKKELFKIGEETFTEYDFVKFIKINKKINSSENKKLWLNKRFTEFVNKSCKTFKANNLKNSNLNYKYLLQEYEEGILLFNLTQKQIWGKSQKDSIGLQNFYEKNKQNYMWAERAKANIYTTKNEIEVQKLLKFLKKRKTEQKILQKLPGLKIEKGNFEHGKNKFLDVVNWQVKTYDPQKWNNEFVVIDIKNILKPAPKKLNEAKGFIMADYQTALTKNWVEILRNKYKVEINKKAFSEILNEI